MHGVHSVLLAALACFASQHCCSAGAAGRDLRPCCGPSSTYLYLPWCDMVGRGSDGVISEADLARNLPRIRPARELTWLQNPG